MRQFGSIENVIIAMLKQGPVETRELRERIIKTLGRVPRYMDEYTSTLTTMIDQGKVSARYTDEGYRIYSLHQASQASIEEAIIVVLKNGPVKKADLKAQVIKQLGGAPLDRDDYSCTLANMIYQAKVLDAIMRDGPSIYYLVQTDPRYFQK